MVGAEELEGSIAPCGSKGLIHSGTDGNHLGVLGGSPSFSLRERSGPWRPGAGRVRCRRACCASEWACYGIVVRLQESRVLLEARVDLSLRGCAQCAETLHT